MEQQIAKPGEVNSSSHKKHSNMGWKMTFQHDNNICLLICIYIHM